MPVLSQYLATFIKNKKKQLACSMACENLERSVSQKTLQRQWQTDQREEKPTAQWWEDALEKNQTHSSIFFEVLTLNLEELFLGFCKAKSTCSANTACATSRSNRQWCSHSFQRGHTRLSPLKLICRWLTQIVSHHKCKAKILLIQGCIISGLSAFTALPST